MADSPILPGQHAWRLTPDGRLPPEFFRFFRDLIAFVARVQGNTDDLTAIEARLDALEAASQNAVSGQASIQAIEQESATILRLVGDVSIPGISRYYGTNSDGAKGWYQRLLATLADVDLTGLADGDALVWDATAERFVPGQPSTPQVFSRITADGDVRITADGDIRITD